MQIEFAQYLRQIIVQVNFEFALGIGDRKLLQESCAKALAQSSIIACPPEINALMASNFPFVFAKLIEDRLRQQGNLAAQVLPEMLARTILDNSSKLDSSKGLFELSTGGQGYLNAVPRVLLLNEFMQKCWELSAAPIFSWSPFCASREEAQKPFIRLRIDWGRIREKCRKSRDRSIREFVLFLASRDRVFEDDVLMALALLAKSQLDTDVYIRGLAGSENIPWYMNKFRQDWRRFAESCFQKAPEVRSVAFDLDLLELQRIRGHEEAAFWPLPRAVIRVLQCILCFREVYLKALDNNQPEILVEHLLRVVRCFYSYYNHPDVRSFRALSRQEVFHLGVLTYVLGNTFEREFESLEFCLS